MLSAHSISVLSSIHEKAKGGAMDMGGGEADE